MTYNINYTESSNPLKNTIIVQDNSADDTLNVVFPGRNYTNYGSIIGENFLHLLENFAAPKPPNETVGGQLVQGQLWFDTNPGISQLKVYDGIRWISAGGLKKGANSPGAGDSTPGELWVNTATQQLFLYTGSQEDSEQGYPGWRLVGPQVSSGEKTGAEPGFITDSNNVVQSVVINFIKGIPVAIISSVQFTPKTAIEGYSIIKVGVNLHSSYNFYYGTSEKANALVVSGNTISSSNFLRKDAASVTDYLFSIKNNSGLNVGIDNQLSLTTSGTTATIKNNSANGTLQVAVSNQRIITVKQQSPQAYVGINNESPSESLDITGNLRFSGVLLSTLSTGTSTFAGNLEVQKSLRVKGSVQADVKVITDQIEITSLTETAIKPTVTNQVDIGSTDNKFKNIYAGQIYADTINGTIQGTASQASRLAAATTFQISGDISSAGFSFDGYPGGETKTFSTSLSDSFINTKTSVTTLQTSDEFLLSTVVGGLGGTIQLRKISKINMWKEISQVKAGMILPFAGGTIPPGWLMCDGAEVAKSTYATLHEVIGATYGTPDIDPVNNFRLPNLQNNVIVGATSGTLGNTGNFAQGAGDSIPWTKMNYIIYTGKDS